jgi:hypothetical protein
MRIRFALALGFAATAVACEGAVDLAYQVMSSESPSPTRVPTRPTAQASGTADPFRSQWVVTGIELGRFRQRYEQRDYSSLYALTDERLRATTTEAQFTASFMAMRERLGSVTRAREVGHLARPIPDTRDVDIVVVFDSVFQRGPAIETFVWHVTSTNLTYLVSYDVR